MLTLAVVSSVVLLFKYYNVFWVWIIAVGIILLTGRRCKERGYYYAREVLIEFLKTER